jgi:hypothetical protein
MYWVDYIPMYMPDQQYVHYVNNVEVMGWKYVIYNEKRVQNYSQ